MKYELIERYFENNEKIELIEIYSYFES